MLLLVACGGGAAAPSVDIEATVEARVKERLAAIPTPTARIVVKDVVKEVVVEKEVPVEKIVTVVVTATPTRTPTPTPTPTLIPTPTIQRQAQTPVFYQQNGLTLEYHWPIDEFNSLSAEETQILAYNESDEVIEFIMPQISFTENGSPRAITSGTWEKFPSRYSWDRIEQIFLLSSYQGEPLIVQPGEKAKIHWHLERITSTDTNQSVALDLTVTTGARTETITLTLVRNSEQSNTDVATAPEPTQEPHETQQSTSTPSKAFELGLPFTAEHQPLGMMPLGETINHDPPQGHPGIDFQWPYEAEITVAVDGIVGDIQEDVNPFDGATIYNLTIVSGKYGVIYEVTDMKVALSES